MQTDVQKLITTKRTANLRLFLILLCVVFLLWGSTFFVRLNYIKGLM